MHPETKEETETAALPRPADVGITPGCLDPSGWMTGHLRFTLTSARFPLLSAEGHSTAVGILSRASAGLRISWVFAGLCHGETLYSSLSPKIPNFLYKDLKKKPIFFPPRYKETHVISPNRALSIIGYFES